jgi:hypothetical protein
MRADEQADICQSEDGEGSLVPNRCHSALELGSGRSVFRLSVVYNSTSYDQPHTGTTMFDRNAGYFCVRWVILTWIAS